MMIVSNLDNYRRGDWAASSWK